MSMTTDLMEKLLNEEESSSLDFKRDQYPFNGASDSDKAELLKDVLAFANSWRRTTAYVLIGVQEVKGGRSNVVGVTGHLADNNLQQFVNSKTNRPISFSYEALEFEDHQVGVITLPKQKRTFTLKASFGGLSKDTVYARQGSSTSVATLDEATRMAAADATEDLALQELAEQRKDREAQRQLQRELHEQLHRPNVVCDFPIVHTIMYLHVKNYGTLPAKNVRVVIESSPELPPVACLRHPISILAPDTDLHYWLYGPQQYGDVPKSLTVNITYEDLSGRAFESVQPHDFAYLGREGLGRGVDISREKNDPIVKVLERVAEALESKPTLPRPPFLRS
jgi:hypothetical protein